MVIILGDLFLSARSRCARQGTKYTDNVVSWAWPGIGHHCVYMLLEGVIYFILVILIEVSVLCDWKSMCCIRLLFLSPLSIYMNIYAYVYMYMLQGIEKRNKWSFKKFEVIRCAWEEYVKSSLLLPQWFHWNWQIFVKLGYFEISFVDLLKYRVQLHNIFELAY